MICAKSQQGPHHLQAFAVASAQGHGGHQRGDAQADERGVGVAAQRQQLGHGLQVCLARCLRKGGSTFSSVRPFFFGKPTVWRVPRCLRPSKKQTPPILCLKMPPKCWYPFGFRLNQPQSLNGWSLVLPLNDSPPPNKLRFWANTK